MNYESSEGSQDIGLVASWFLPSTDIYSVPIMCQAPCLVLVMMHCEQSQTRSLLPPWNSQSSGGDSD